jgi:hypothetical protein
MEVEGEELVSEELVSMSELDLINTLSEVLLCCMHCTMGGHITVITLHNAAICSLFRGAVENYIF